MLKYWIIFTSALISCMVFTFFLGRISLKYKILKINNIPLVGGLGIGLALIFSLTMGFLIFDLYLIKVSVILGVSLLMLFFGVIDDLKELSVVQKLIVQSFCAFLLILFGIRTDIMYLGFWGNVAVTFFWILGITNAFNLLDIMDGLAAGAALIVSCAFLLVGFLSSDLNVQVLSLILSAVSAGFLIFNLPPARIYLGNSGSHLLGLLISSVALITHYASIDNVFALFSPIMILGLPIIDTISLIIFRIIKRRPPFKKSRDHLALKIGALVFSPSKTILIMYLLCFVFASCGVVLSLVNNLFAAGIIAAIFLFSIWIFWRLVKIEANG